MRKTIALTMEIEVEGPDKPTIDSFEELIQGDVSEAVLQQIWDDTCPQCKDWAQSQEYGQFMQLSLVKGRLHKPA